jgi:hypothetical protein
MSGRRQPLVAWSGRSSYLLAYAALSQRKVPSYTRIVDSQKPSRPYVFLVVVLLASVLVLPASALTATGQYEVYCDGVGIFLAKIDDVPTPGKLVLFSYLSFPSGTEGGRYLGQGKWSDAFVYRDGCVPDGKCESIAHGKVWIDAWDKSDTGDLPPKRTTQASTNST